LVNNRYSLDTDGLAAGIYQLTAEIVDKSTGAVVDVADLGGLLITSPNPGAPTRPVDAALGEPLSLLGYDLIQGRSNLVLSPHWTVRENMDRDYKFFAHLIDTKSGVLAAQYNAVPLAWGYPTSTWETGRVVADLMIIPLNQIPPGEYSLNVGAYDMGTGERLAGEGQITLPETITIPGPASE
jgi:hypothetical protein